MIELRPEIRFVHALEAEAYDNPTATPNGGRHAQAMIAADAILRDSAPPGNVANFEIPLAARDRQVAVAARHMD